MEEKKKIPSEEAATSVVMLSLLLLLGGIYWFAMSNAGWVYDDLHSIVSNPAIRENSNLLRFFWDPALFSGQPGMGMYRPLLLVSYWACWKLFALDPFGWHAVNFLLHVGTCVGVYVFSRDKLATILFAFSPLAVEPIGYISARSEGMMVFFGIWSLALTTRGATLGGRRYISAALYALALLTKESAVVFLLLEIGFAWLGAVPARIWIYVNRWKFIVTGIYFLLLLQVGFVTKSLAAAPRSLSSQLWTQVAALPRTILALAGAPILSIDPGLATFTHPWSGEVALGLGCIVVLAIILWKARQSDDFILLFSLGGAVLSLIPTSLYPLTMVSNDRRLYLPAIFLAIGVADLIQREYSQSREGTGRRLFVMGMVGLTFGFSAVNTYNRAREWDDDLLIWESAARWAPTSARVLNNLADIYRRNPDTWPKAEELYQRVLSTPDSSVWPAALNNLGSLRYLRGDLKGAAGYYRRSLDRENSADVKVNLGNVFFKEPNYPLARALYEDALRENENHYGANYNLGLLLDTIGDHRQADCYFSQAQRIDLNSYAAARRRLILREE